VANRQVDLATVSSEAIDRLEGTYPEKHKLLRVVWRSPTIPLDPIVWRTDLPAATKEKIRSFFVGYGSPQPGKSDAELKREKDVMFNLQSGSFRASSNKQLIPLRQIGLFRDKLRLEADDKMPAAEKAAKIQEIDAKLRQLEKDAAVGS
jgi:phosphonate transport system substrate-binding protein